MRIDSVRVVVVDWAELEDDEVLTQAETEAVAVKRRMRAEICIAMVMVCEDWVLRALELFRWWVVLGMEEMRSSYQR